MRLILYGGTEHVIAEWDVPGDVNPDYLVRMTDKVVYGDSGHTPDDGYKLHLMDSDGQILRWWGVGPNWNEVQITCFLKDMIGTTLYDLFDEQPPTKPPRLMFMDEGGWPRHQWDFDPTWDVDDVVEFLNDSVGPTLVKYIDEEEEDNDALIRVGDSVGTSEYGGYAIKRRLNTVTSIRSDTPGSLAFTGIWDYRSWEYNQAGRGNLHVTLYERPWTKERLRPFLNKKVYLDTPTVKATGRFDMVSISSFRIVLDSGILRFTFADIKKIIVPPSTAASRYAIEIKV